MCECTLAHPIMLLRHSRLEVDPRKPRKFSASKTWLYNVCTCIYLGSLNEVGNDRGLVFLQRLCHHLSAHQTTHLGWEGGRGGEAGGGEVGGGRGGEAGGGEVGGEGRGGEGGRE